MERRNRFNIYIYDHDNIKIGSILIPNAIHHSAYLGNTIFKSRWINYKIFGIRIKRKDE